MSEERAQYVISGTHSSFMPDWIISTDFALRMAVAGVLGALFGIERDLHARPAGLRTLMLISLGCCLFGIISSEGYADADGTMDPTRIASIVVQGIGFLGAGVMLKGENTILGITTAATIWLVAAIGLAVGAGMEAEAVTVALGSLLALVALEPVSNALERIGNRRMERRGGDVVQEA